MAIKKSGYETENTQKYKQDVKVKIKYGHGASLILLLKIKFFWTGDTSVPGIHSGVHFADLMYPLI